MVKKPTLILSPDGSWDANGRFDPALTGGVRVVDGPHGKAWQTAETTTNLVRNPAFMHASPLTGWSSQFVTTEILPPSPEAEQAGVSRSIVKITKIVGPSSVFWTDTAGAYVIPATGGQPYAGSMWVKGIAGRTIEMVMYFRDAGGYMSAGKNTLEITSDQWDRYKISAVAPTGTTHVTLMIYLNSSSAANAVDGESAFISSPQLEQKSHATPYADGDMPGHTWAGTPHASASTRPGSCVSHGWSPKPDSGAIIMRAANLSVPGNAFNRYFFSAGLPSAGHIFLAVAIDEATGRLRRVVYVDGVNLTGDYVYSPPMVEGEMMTVALTWDNGIVRFYADGNLIETNDLRAYTWITTTQPLSLGNYSGFFSNLAVESALTFDTALTDADIAEYTAMANWQVLNPNAGDARIPYRSSMLTFEREVFIADGNNNIIEDITPLVRSVITDIDAARADSKVEANIETYTDPIADGDWVSIYHTLTPEQGDIVRRQRCLVRVETPRIQYTGGGEEIGMSTGRDIIRDMAMATLDIPFYTPIDGWVMGDVELAIRMLGITSLGPNTIIANGGFEDNGAGWGASAGQSAVVTTSWTTSSTPEGKNVYRALFAGGSPAGGYAYAVQSAVPLPAGSRRLFVSGLVYGRTDHGAGISVRFRDANGTEVSTDARINTAAHNAPIPFWTTWIRQYAVGDVPDWATSFTIYTFITVNEASTGPGATMWDDIQVRECTGDLLPASMLALPQSTAKATSRIQNGIGDPILEVVSDRLNAIGIHSPYTTPDGRPTSRPILASEQDTATRSYDVDDARISDTVRIEASPSERANKVIAVKEVHDEPPLVATAYNRNPDDPYSLENYPPRSVRISMYDAVDVDALRAAALDELSRRVVRDEISFKIMPDPDINIHDVIEVTGPPSDRRVGRWIIISIRDGSSGSNPAMEILARRVSLGEWS